MEIFNGVYEIKVSHPAALQKKASVSEISSDTIRLKSGDEDTTKVTVKAAVQTDSKPADIIAIKPMEKAKIEAKPMEMSLTEAVKKAEKSLVEAKEVKTERKSIVESMLEARKEAKMTSNVSSNQVVTQQKSEESSSVMSSSSKTTSVSHFSAASTSIQQNSMALQSSVTPMQQNLNSSVTPQNLNLQTSNETHVQGQKFNITNSLKKTSHHNSTEDISRYIKFFF